MKNTKIKALGVVMLVSAMMTIVGGAGLVQAAVGDRGGSASNVNRNTNWNRNVNRNVDWNRNVNRNTNWNRNVNWNRNTNWNRNVNWNRNNNWSRYRGSWYRHNTHYFRPLYRNYWSYYGGVRYYYPYVNRFFVYMDPYDYVFPGNVIIINRDALDQRIEMRNEVTGPGSTNVIRLNVDSNTFARLQNEISVNNDINLRVNTGNNTVSFNTSVGNIVSGDVEIDIE